MDLPEMELHRNKHSPEFVGQTVGNTVYGTRLAPGTVLEPNDLYDSTTGIWDKCMCVGTKVPDRDDVVWVRPRVARDTRNPYYRR